MITDAFMTIASLSDEASKTDEHADRQTQTKPDTAKSRERSTERRNKEEETVRGAESECNIVADSRLVSQGGGVGDE